MPIVWLFFVSAVIDRYWYTIWPVGYRMISKVLGRVVSPKRGTSWYWMMRRVPSL